VQTEFLTADEIAEVTGYKHTAQQRDWLDRNGWTYVTNAVGRPIVNRWYARLRMAGVKPTITNTQTAWMPDFSGIENAT
jgi:hypothetical protein